MEKLTGCFMKILSPCFHNIGKKLSKESILDFLEEKAIKIYIKEYQK
jgi:hypothetical protein